MVTRKEAYAIGMSSKFGGSQELWKKHYSRLDEKKHELEKEIEQNTPDYKRYKNIERIITKGVKFYFE